MRKLMTLMAAAAVVAVALPNDGSAQGRVSPAERNARDAVRGSSRNDDRSEDRRDGRYENCNDVRNRNDPRCRDNDDRWDDRRDRNDRDDDWYDGRRRDNDDRYDTRGKGNGPAFCRSGAGHPVHGRQWCVNKGHGLGGNARWDRVRWDDVIFRRPQRADSRLDRGDLSDILGSVVLGRLDARRRTFGINQPLTGRWINDEGRSVLMVNAGNYPLAELIDGNRDRRVDLVLVNSGR